MRKKRKKGKWVDYDDENTIGDDPENPYEEYEDTAYSSDYSDDDNDDEPLMRSAKRKKRRSHMDTGRAIQNLLIIAAVLCGVVVVYCALMSFIGPGKRQCKKLIDDVQTSCNELDLKELVYCLNPDIRSTALPMIVVGETLTGGNLRSILRTIVRGLGIDLGDDDYETSFKTIRITPLNYGIPFVTRKVRCRVNIIGIDHYVVLTIKKQDGEAYLDNVKIVYK